MSIEMAKTQETIEQTCPILAKSGLTGQETEHVDSKIMSLFTIGNWCAAKFRNLQGSKAPMIHSNNQSKTKTQLSFSLQF